MITGNGWTTLSNLPRSCATEQMLCTISHWFSSPWWQWCSRECYLSERRRCYDPNRRCSDTSGTPQTTWGTIAHCRAEPRRRCLRIRIGMHHQPAQSHKSVRDRLVSSKSVDICIYRGIRATRVGGESSCWAVGCPGQPSDGPDAALPFYRRPSGGAAQKKKKKKVSQYARGSPCSRTPPRWQELSASGNSQAAQLLKALFAGKFSAQGNTTERGEEFQKPDGVLFRWCWFQHARCPLRKTNR